MNYELCKQLKDAGFPQKLHPFTGLMYEDASPNVPIHCANDKGCYCPEHTGEPYSVIPNLPELIKACGERFDSLVRHIDGTWSAWGNLGTKLIDKWEETGTTPEEAVANLWLKLNEKPNERRTS